MTCTFANVDGTGRGELAREATSKPFFDLQSSNGSYSLVDDPRSRHAYLRHRSSRAATNGGFADRFVVAVRRHEQEPLLVRCVVFGHTK